MTGDKLEAAVARIAVALHMNVRQQFVMGRRVWGSRRQVDVIVTHPITNQRLGIECKFQAVGGTAEEKIIAALEDIAAWPIRGIIVMDGEGFSEHMTHYALASGRAVMLEDLDVWLRMFFNLEIP